MALSRIGHLRLNTSLFNLHLKKCNYQSSIFFLSTSTISYSNVQKEGQASKMFKKYENFIEKKFPRYYLLHRQIVDGSKWCISDFKTYRSLRKGLKSNEVTIDNFSKKELECYIQQVLTRYYWSPQKRKEFWSAILISKSQKHFGPLLSNIKLSENLSLPIEISEIDNHNVIVPKLEEMDGSQLYHLLRLYEISPFSGVTKLKERSLLIHCLDKKLISENDNTIDAMDESEVITQLYIRRIMFTSDENINILRERLKTWVKYSGQLYENGNEGLLLYIPAITQGIRNIS